MTPTSPSAAAVESRSAIESGVRYIRALLERRILWLRRCWKHDPFEDDRNGIISDQRADWLLAGEDPDRERSFYQDDPRARELTDLIEQLRRESVADDSSSLAVIARMFGLGEFERDVLLLAVAPEFDPLLDRLYAYAEDDLSRKYATAHLAHALFKPAFPRLHAEVPLLRFRLVSIGSDVGAAPGARPLRAEDRVIDFIRGVNRLDERVAALLAPLAAAPVADCHLPTIDRLVEQFRAGQADWRLLNVNCSAASGPESFTRALCDRLGITAWRLDSSRVPAPGPQRDDLLRLVEREAILAQFIIYIDAEFLPEQELDWLDRLNNFFVVRSQARIRSRRHSLAISLNRPAAGDVIGLWQAAFDHLHLTAPSGLDEVAQQFDFPPEAIMQTAVAAVENSRFDSRSTVTAQDLWQACRRFSDRRMEGPAQRLDPQFTWDDLVLPDDVAEQLQEIALQVRYRHRVYEGWGFGAKLPRGRGVTALFAGPSGTGKTMATEVIAGELGLDLYRIDLASTVSKYIGETEKNLKRLFDAAEHGGAILFFDEADALFGKRTEVKDSHDRYANIEVNYLLQRMEDYRGLAVLATNRKGALDRAFLRRLRFLVDFPFPDSVSRRLIWEKSFPAGAPLGEIHFDALSRLEFAGGNIRNITLNAAFLAAGASEPIGMKHIEHAARRECAKIDQVFRENRIWLEEASDDATPPAHRSRHCPYLGASHAPASGTDAQFNPPRAGRRCRYAAGASRIQPRACPRTAGSGLHGEHGKRCGEKRPKRIGGRMMRCLRHCESTLTAPPNLFRETAPAPAPRLIPPSRSSNVLRSFQDPSPAAPAPAPVHVTEQNFAGGGQIEQEREASFLLWNFDVGQDRLKTGHIDAINSLAPTLKARLASDADAVIDIEGRASATGSKNQALSERRANAVRDVLVKEGIDAGKININAVGEFKALPDNTQENLARSRAVRIMIAPRFAPPPASTTPTSDQFATCAPSLVGDVSMEGGPVELKLDPDTLARNLQAGTGADQPGMIFIATATLPQKCTGEILFVQNVQTYREIVYKDQSRNTLATTDWMLDTDDPFPSQSFGTNPQALVQTANDSPAMGILKFPEPAVLTLEVRDDFRMFIMFKPTGKDRKTLQVGRWSFIGQAQTDDPKLDPHLVNGSLVLDKGVSRVIPQKGTAVNSTMMPVLAPNITSLKWIANNAGMQTGGKSFADMSLSILNRPKKKKKT